MLQLSYVKWEPVAYSSRSWTAEAQGASKCSVWSGCLPCPTAAGLLLPPHMAEAEMKLPWTCRRRPKPTRKSKANPLRFQHHSLNRSKGEGSVMTCTQIILQCKKCFNISHLMPTLIQLLAHFVD